MDKIVSQVLIGAATTAIPAADLTLPVKAEGIAVGTVDGGGMGIVMVTIVAEDGAGALAVALDPDGLIKFLSALSVAAGQAREIGCAPGCPCGRGGTAH